MEGLYVICVVESEGFCDIHKVQSASAYTRTDIYSIYSIMYIDCILTVYITGQSIWSCDPELCTESF